MSAESGKSGQNGLAKGLGPGLAGLALLTILEQLSRKGRLAMSISAPDTGSPLPSGAVGRRDSATGTSYHSQGRQRHGDAAPGEQREGADVRASVRSYLIGLALAALLTAGSFGLSYTNLIYGPGVDVALIVFAIAQVGVHLVFFLHLTTSPDNINNAMALAFGTLIVLLLIGGTLWIMMHMNANMLHPGTGMPPGHAGHSMPMR